ncbi:MAG: glycosyltransferase [Bacteroidetes bacterium]|nr:glycosyltransferase [Bacteroidota bacterium]
MRSLFYSGNFPAPLRYDTGEIYVFLRSHNRPLYLWATLDSLYKSTKSPCKFVLIDNASTDPQIKEVINGFERRGMFHAVHYMETNAGGNQQKIFEHYRENIGKYFFLCDTDIIIEPMPHCWIAIMIDIAERNPDVSLLGSYIDTSDFVSIDKAKDLEPQLDDTELSELIKIKSPERNNPPKTAEIIYPFRPAGRLLLAKTEAIDNTRLYASNKDLCNAFEKNGYKHGITTRVVHRHLSLMNIFDYPKYDYNELFTYINGH